MCLELTYSTILAFSSNSSGHHPLLKCQVPASLPGLQVPMLVQSPSPCTLSLTHTIGWPQPADHPPAHPECEILSRTASLAFFALCLLIQGPWNALALPFLSQNLAVKISSCCLCAPISVFFSVPYLCGLGHVPHRCCWHRLVRLGVFAGAMESFVVQSSFLPARAVSSQDLSACFKHSARLREWFSYVSL